MHLTKSNSNRLAFFFKSYMPQWWTKPRKMSVWRIIFVMDCDERFCTSCMFNKEEEMKRMQATTGQLTSCWSLGRLWNKSSLKPHPGPWGIKWPVIATTVMLAQPGCRLWWVLWTRGWQWLLTLTYSKNTEWTVNPQWGWKPGWTAVLWL